MLPRWEEPVDKFRKGEIEEAVRKYYKAYDLLADIPKEAVHKLRSSSPNLDSLKDKLTVDAMRSIAEVEPFLDGLSCDEQDLLMELFSTDECKRGQADRIACEKGISRRSMFNRKRDVLRKLDALLPQNPTTGERDAMFARRWRS